MAVVCFQGVASVEFGIRLYGCMAPTRWPHGQDTRFGTSCFSQDWSFIVVRDSVIH